jgi:hypothetical protein
MFLRKKYAFFYLCVIKRINQSRNTSDALAKVKAHDACQQIWYTRIMKDIAGGLTTSRI